MWKVCSKLDYRCEPGGHLSLPGYVEVTITVLIKKFEWEEVWGGGGGEEREKKDHCAVIIVQVC